MAQCVQQLETREVEVGLGRMREEMTVVEARTNEKVQQHMYDLRRELSDAQKDDYQNLRASIIIRAKLSNYAHELSVGMNYIRTR